MKTLEKISLFWDVDQASLDLDKHQSFVVGRILEKGDIDDIVWASSYYGHKFVKEIFQKKINTLDLKSNNFWCLYFNLNKSECIRKQSIQKQSPFWQR